RRAVSHRRAHRHRRRRRPLRRAVPRQAARLVPRPADQSQGPGRPLRREPVRRLDVQTIRELAFGTGDARASAMEDPDSSPNPILIIPQSDPGDAMTQTELRPAASQVDLDALDAWWRAANYLSVGQIYLL